MELNIVLQGDKELSLKLKKLSESDLLAAKNKILRTVAILLQGEAKKLVPADTGALRRSIFYRIYKDYAQVYSNVSYAEYIHEGTKPRLITPVKKKSLYWEKNKIGYFAKSVRHPGTKAYSFFENAVKNCKNEILKRCNEILQSVIDKY